MSKIKVIRTDKDYEEALKLVESLMSRDPDPDSEEGEQLGLLSTLIQDYEARSFPVTFPNPIEAIKFRMEQADLRPADLIPFIGSRSRVSEILSGKRQLTLEMVRALEEGLGIPAKVLIKKPEIDDDALYKNWDKRLVAEMEARGYFGGASLKKYGSGELVRKFFSSIGAPALVGMFRKSSHYRSSPLTNKHALAAWAIRVLQKANKIKTPKKHEKGTVDLKFMQEIAKLSKEEKSPLLAQEYLKKYGVLLVIEPHFSKTHLDGAVLFVNKDNPVIGLTLRYDRLDNFWFTLMHELAHIALHSNQNFNFYYDEFENVKGLNIDDEEKKADNLASEALVPSAKWEISPARLIPSSLAAASLAKELGVDIAIVAGKIRYEGGKWAYLNNIIDQAKVQKYFPNEK